MLKDLQVYGFILSLRISYKIKLNVKMLYRIYAIVYRPGSMFSELSASNKSISNSQSTGCFNKYKFKSGIRFNNSSCQSMWNQRARADLCRDKHRPASETGIN